ncbi:MAG: outer membrane beta-barrel protein [Crocinitomicaceae bacterium]
MKKIFTLMALIGLAQFGHAQEENKGSDTTRFKIGSMEFIIIDKDTLAVDNDGNIDPDNENDKSFEMKYDKNDLTYWSGFDVGVNLLMNNQFQSSFTEDHLTMDPAQSFSYSFNFAETRIRIAGDYFGIVTGLGFTNSRFGFSNDRLRLTSTADTTMGVIDTTLANGFNRNQLRVNYFNVPVLLHFNTSKNPDKNFHISMGIIGGVRIGSKMKYKYDILGGEAKDRVKAKYNLNPFHASLTARMGYKNFGVFANFDMLPLFENQASRVAKPLTFGASFIF